MADRITEDKNVLLNDGTTKFFGKGTLYSEIDLANDNAVINMQNKEREQKKGKPRVSAILEGDPLQSIEAVAESGWKFLKDTVTPVLHPVQTATSLYSLGKGIVQLALPPEQRNKVNAQLLTAIGEMVANRYGSREAFLNTMDTDPIGVMGDIALLLTGTGFAAKAVGKISSVAKVAKKISNGLIKGSSYIDPLTLGWKSTKYLGGAGRVYAAQISNLGTDILDTATDIGRGTDEVRKINLLDNMRGITDEGELVTTALENLNTLKQEKLSKYAKEIDALKLDTIIVKPKIINNIVEEISNNLNKYDKYGQTLLDDADKIVRKKILQSIADFKNNPDMHTVAGLDFLKKQIDGFRPNSITAGNKGNALVTNAYNIVRDNITNPKYKDIMKEYELASTQQASIIKELGLNNNAKVNKAMVLRKLKAAYKTESGGVNFKERKKMVKELDPSESLTDKLTGSALNPTFPQGMGGALAKQAAPIAAITYASGASNPFTALPILANMAASSPRLQGKLAYGIGNLQGKANRNRFIPKKSTVGNVLRGTRVYGELSPDEDYLNRNMM